MNIRRLSVAAMAATTGIVVFTVSGCGVQKATPESRFRVSMQAEWDAQSAEKQALACGMFRTRPNEFLRDASEFVLANVASMGTQEEKEILTPAFVTTNMKAFFVETCGDSEGS